MPRSSSDIEKNSHKSSSIDTGPELKEQDQKPSSETKTTPKFPEAKQNLKDTQDFQDTKPLLQVSQKVDFI